MAEVQDLDAAGKYKDAIDALKQNPTYDATYFYNLGVLYGKMKQPGLATAYLEKANHDKPHDPEILASLRTAKSELQAQLLSMHAEVTIDGASNQLERFSDRIQNDEILGVVGLVTVLVSLLWIRAYLKTRHITKTFLKPSGWFGVLALVLVFAVYGMFRAGSANEPALVTLSEPLRSGPGMNYPEITEAVPGIKVRMIGSPMTVNENELWQKVRYKTNQTAWIHLSSLLPL
jgi:tetratricopeptide (TPR) repeat protein